MPNKEDGTSEEMGVQNERGTEAGGDAMTDVDTNQFEANTLQMVADARATEVPTPEVEEEIAALSSELKGEPVLAEVEGGKDKMDMDENEEGTKEESLKALQVGFNNALEEGDITECEKVLEEAVSKNLELNVSEAVSKSLASGLKSFGVKLEKVSSIIDFARSHDILPDVASLMQLELEERSSAPVHNLANLLDVAEENGVELDLSVLSEGVPKVVESLLSYEQINTDMIMDQVQFCKRHNIPLDLTSTIINARNKFIEDRDNPGKYALPRKEDPLKLIDFNNLALKLGINL